MLKPGRMKEIMKQIGKAKDLSLFSCGHKERTGRNGTGFIINPKMRKSFLSFEPLSDRLCTLTSRGKFRNINLVSTHASNEDSPDAIKDEFYDQLSQECEKARKYDILILLGGFSAKIRRKKLYSNSSRKIHFA
jgi:hypothetical protein